MIFEAFADAFGQFPPLSITMRRLPKDYGRARRV